MGGKAVLVFLFVLLRNTYLLFIKWVFNTKWTDELQMVFACNTFCSSPAMTTKTARLRVKNRDAQSCQQYPVFQTSYCLLREKGGRWFPRALHVAVKRRVHCHPASGCTFPTLSGFLCARWCSERLKGLSRAGAASRERWDALLLGCRMGGVGGGGDAVPWGSAGITVLPGPRARGTRAAVPGHQDILEHAF